MLPIEPQVQPSCDTPSGPSIVTAAFVLFLLSLISRGVTLANVSKTNP